MKIEGEAKRVRVYIGESDHWHGKALATAIVERCRTTGLAGATVVRGIQGFGANSRIHTTSILNLSTDLPLVVEIVDSAERIDALLPLLDEMVTEGMITVEPVHVYKYVHAPPRADGSATDS
jgi:PII-like signaling protein